MFGLTEEPRQTGSAYLQQCLPLSTQLLSPGAGLGLPSLRRFEV